MTVTDTPAVAEAIETAPPGKVSSHLHPDGSFDVADFVVPTGREEIWRFTPLKRLHKLHDDAPFGAALDLVVDAADGVSVEQVGADDASRGSSGHVPRDRVAVRAYAAAEGATVVRVPREQVVEGVTTLTFTGSGTDVAAAGHVVVHAEKFSRSTVALVFEGSAVAADTVEIVVEDGAALTVVSLQDWADDAVHHSTQHASVGRDATLRHIAVSFGGDVVRHDTTAEYSGPGGTVEMLGLYFADAGQHIEHRLFVDHNEPRTRSNVSTRARCRARARTRSGSATC